MPYNSETAERIRNLIAGKKGFTEKSMFGGIGFLLNGNMCCGVWKDFLILRIGSVSHDQLIGKKFVRPFDITGRAMRGWIMVESEAFKERRALQGWIQRAFDFVATLPEK